VTQTKSRPIAILVFLVLVFPLSWYPWVLALMVHKTSGPNPLGILVAGLIASAVARGWRGTRDLLLSMVRVGARPLCWAVAIFGAPLILAGALAVAPFVGVPVAWHPPTTDLVERFVFTLVFVALGEEPGWRGYFLPALEERLHPLLATLAVAVVWAVWHLPLLGNEFSWTIVPYFLVSLLGGAFVLAWLFNDSRSVLLCMLLHAILNTIGPGYAFHMVAAADQQRFWMLYAAAWAVAGLVAIVFTRGRLDYVSPEAGMSDAVSAGPA